MRSAAKYARPPPNSFVCPRNRARDVIIVGAGHNGLTAAAYLAQKGLDVLVLERRGIIGGAAVTEEVFPGYKFSRASYLAGLLRPKVIEELELQTRYGLSFIRRNPSSFTPTRINDPMYKGRSLFFWSDEDKTRESIAQFSQRDAQRFAEYEAFLGRLREVLQPLLDGAPPQIGVASLAGLFGNWKGQGSQMKSLLSELGAKQSDLPWFYEFLTAPASVILDRWFESEILKTTLATDAVIGSVIAPSEPGSAYVLLHHVMGQIEDTAGVWAYCRGGMGSISNAIARCAQDRGAEIVCNARVEKLILKRDNNNDDSSDDDDHSDGNSKLRCEGVLMDDGTMLTAKVAVLSNATAYHTFCELMDDYSERDECNGYDPSSSSLSLYQSVVRESDYKCGAFKMNCVVNELPNFECMPNERGVSFFKVGPQHCGTVHFESRMHELEDAARQARLGKPADTPVIEMTIPSALDDSLVPISELGRKHIVQLFVQYAPYELDPSMNDGLSDWDDNGGELKHQFADRVFDIIDEFAPNFSNSVQHRDLLSPRDLEREFALHKGNIFQGAISLHQIGYARPVPGWSDYRTPVNGLWLCGASTHPGGGVMGAPGRNAARALLAQLKLL